MAFRVLVQYREDLDYLDDARRHYSHFKRDSFELEYDQMREMKDHQDKVRILLKEAAGRLQEGDIAASTRAIYLANESSQQVEKLVQGVWNIIPVTKKTTAASTAKAEEVFRTPELLEMILSYLPTKQKLKAWRVQRCWYDTFQGSVALQKSLGLVPQGDRHYFSPFSRRFGIVDNRVSSGKVMPCDMRLCDQEPDFDYELNSECSRSNVPRHETDYPQNLVVTVTCYADENASQYSERVGSMQVFSPQPIKVMAELQCSYRHCSMDWLEDENVSVARFDGFTVAGFAKVTAELCAGHEECELPYVEYVCIIDLPDDDPVMKKRHQLKNRCEQEREERHKTSAQRAKDATERHAAWVRTQGYDSDDEDVAYNEDFEKGMSEGEKLRYRSKILRQLH